MYHLPKEPRFRFDENTNKVISLVPNIDVVDEYHGGREVRHKWILLKVGEKYYCIRVISTTKYDEAGNQVFRYVNGKKLRSDQVWTNVYLGNAFYGDRPEQGRKTEEARLTSLDDTVTDIVFEYLATDKNNINYEKVHRIIFSDDEPITPKNWRVI